MPLPEDDGTTPQECFVRAAAEMMEIRLDPAWLPGIVRNIELLLNAARVTQVPGSERIDVGQRFEP
ncbi:MAG: AtzG-like protein [Pseudorhodoplanes sp.]|uniref:hypothetical protein n=1 Tax=Pseudorhodoplanes sp. TaxID=1934341 RepID=UPI003D0A3C84